MHCLVTNLNGDDRCLHQNFGLNSIHKHRLQVLHKKNFCHLFCECYLILSVSSARIHNTMETIQNRIVTLISFQPISSK